MCEVTHTLTHILTGVAVIAAYGTLVMGRDLAAQSHSQDMAATLV